MMNLHSESHFINVALQIRLHKSYRTYFSNDKFHSRFISGLSLMINGSLGD